MSPTAIAPTVLPIVRLGHPALRTPARALSPAEIATPETQALIDDMVATMFAADGVGLAAPQVGEEIQLFVLAIALSADDPEPEIPLRVVVNPMLDPDAGPLVHDWEGCLSIPGLRGLVPRHPSLRLRGLDRHGKPMDVRLEGVEARIVQHEFDHLNGVIFLDRMRDLQSLTYAEEAEEHLDEHDDSTPGRGPGFAG
ncbi:MAG: peptide deformylase [Acidobacteriota bacterium]